MLPNDFERDGFYNQREKIDIFHQTSTRRPVVLTTCNNLWFPKNKKGRRYRLRQVLPPFLTFFSASSPSVDPVESSESDFMSWRRRKKFTTPNPYNVPQNAMPLGTSNLIRNAFNNVVPTQVVAYAV
mmetsp:Transcript_14576/g.29167  ORF Transcript_14576/g.29167 Transcript_14576/m.29167 type:complete len:127 (-) Transcript_14576:749-1129(-)